MSPSLALAMNVVFSITKQSRRKDLINNLLASFIKAFLAAGARSVIYSGKLGHICPVAAYRKHRLVSLRLERSSYLEGLCFPFEFFNDGGQRLGVDSVFDEACQDGQSALVKPAIQNLGHLVED